MPGLLYGHVAAVTGAGSGIGRAIAQGFAREGAAVAALDKNGEAAARTAAQIKDAGGEAFAFTLDVTDAQACRAVADAVVDAAGRVSVLVNNAGITRRNAFTADPEAVAADWREVLDVNLNGMFNVTQAFLAPLRAAKGRIVNLASIQSFVHLRTPSSAAYTASKHGVLGFTRALAAELGKEGVRVNAIGPGFIRDRDQRRRARQQSGAGQNLPRPHAARPRRPAGRHRRSGNLPGVGSVGLRHRLDHHGRRRLPHGVSGRLRLLRWSPRSGL